MKKLKPLWWLLAGVGWQVLSTVQAAQSVKPITPILFADPQANVPVTLVYTVTTPDTESSTGLGLRVHYNSSALDWVSQTAYASQLQPVGATSADTQNLDGDSTTDKYWVLAWVDSNAAWPGIGTTPLNLLSSNFKAKSGFTGSTTIRFSASATAKNTSFQTHPLVVCAKPTVSLATTDAIANEKDANTASFRISLASLLPTDCGNLTINYQLGGTATVGKDYVTLSGAVTIPAGSQHADVLLTPLADSSTEADESITLTLQAGSGYQLASTFQASAQLQDASTNTLPTVMLTSAKLQVLEGTDNTVNLTIARQASDLSKALTVYLQASGSAIVGSDYQALPNSLVIPAGQTKANLVLNVLNDALQEPNETLKISLQANAAYQLADLNTLDLTLLDDELRSNTNLAIDQTKPQNVPTLSVQMLLCLSACLALLVLINPPLRQCLKAGAKA